MNYNEVCETLDYVKMLYTRLSVRLDEYNRIFDIGVKITPEMDGLPHGNTISRKVENAGIKLADLSKTLDAQIEHYLNYRQTIIDYLLMLDEKEYKIMYLHYLCFCSWAEVAEKTGYSSVQVWRLKKKSLNFLKDVMKCNRM